MVPPMPPEVAAPERGLDMSAASRGPERNPLSIDPVRNPPPTGAPIGPDGNLGIGCSNTVVKESELVSGLIRLIHLGMDLHQPAVEAIGNNFHMWIHTESTEIRPPMHAFSTRPPRPSHLLPDTPASHLWPSSTEGKKKGLQHEWFGGDGKTSQGARERGRGEAVLWKRWGWVRQRRKETGEKT